MDKYVLYTPDNTYVVEYLFDTLVLSEHISEAMVFEDAQMAAKFRKILLEKCDLITSINTFLS
jgi:hypothetical protein